MNDFINFPQNEYDEIVSKVKEVVDVVQDIRDKNDSLDKPKRLPESKFTQMVYARLNTVLRKRPTFKYNQAMEMYANNPELVRKKFNEILDLIDFINVNGIMYIIDKQMLCAYLRITVTTYQDFLNGIDATVCDDTRELFEEMEEMLISALQSGSETNIRNSVAVGRRLSTKGKYGGHDIEYHSRKDQTIVIAGDAKLEEIQRKLATTYNFGELKEPNSTTLIEHNTPLKKKK